MIQVQIWIALIGSIITITSAVVTLYFLPAIIELKKPRDAGPRLISDTYAKAVLSMLSPRLLDIEEEQILTSQPSIKVAIFLYAIPSLELNSLF
jgi:hypothetical protein